MKVQISYDDISSHFPGKSERSGMNKRTERVYKPRLVERHFKLSRGKATVNLKIMPSNCPESAFLAVSHAGILILDTDRVGYFFFFYFSIFIILIKKIRKPDALHFYTKSPRFNELLNAGR